MPQINQLADVAYSQFFWLLLVLGLIYFGIGKAMLPKIQSTVEGRQQRIAEDLAAAQAATMLERAAAEAEGIRRQAEADAAALIERRTRMAEDKIAAAERHAL